MAPDMGIHGARVADVPIGACCRSGQLMAEAQCRAWQLYAQDAVVAQSDDYYIAEGFGVEVEHHDDSAPTLKTPVVRTLQDIERLRVPNPATDGRMPVYLDMISPAMYRKWAWPMERTFFETIRPRGHRCRRPQCVHPGFGLRSVRGRASGEPPRHG